MAQRIMQIESLERRTLLTAAMDPALVALREEFDAYLRDHSQGDKFQTQSPGVIVTGQYVSLDMVFSEDCDPAAIATALGKLNFKFDPNAPMAEDAVWGEGDITQLDDIAAIPGMRFVTALEPMPPVGGLFSIDPTLLRLYDEHTGQSKYSDYYEPEYDVNFADGSEFITGGQRDLIGVEGDNVVVEVFADASTLSSALKNIGAVEIYVMTGSEAIAMIPITSISVLVDMPGFERADMPFRGVVNYDITDVVHQSRLDAGVKVGTQPMTSQPAPALPATHVSAFTNDSIAKDDTGQIDPQDLTR